MTASAPSAQITILGCGSSGGVPRVGIGWGNCDSANPRNRRRRCSILVERTSDEGTTRVLVDTSPDLREQLLSADVQHLDGVLITHAHADHIHGIDDVRPLILKMRHRINIHMDAPTAEAVLLRFDYIFQTPPGSQYPPLLDFQPIEDGRACVIDGAGGPVAGIPFRLDHGDIDALGFRFGDIAYTPDVVGIPDVSLPYLENLDVWIIDALQYRPHPSHFSLSQALDWIARMKPRRAILTNLNTDLDFERLKSEIPAGVEPAWDGMTLTFDM
ncbi:MULTISPECIES: MBL fold metallo-hydrolase [unclassified Beijerinckia]|uniref:MBL fold metallo-hydrolase n=1 Tax=unclassified Beijerinckia TaxID=2638183 RepID=UPI000894706F|nr:MULTISPECIES: MBL fold metallo-hydrolase [unclassified Beijerinckia]MDH7795082.1 phosphoribosyl 1,2-cyclic phosphate phosphodiesterase [Beijerinckia sp. GAS462]SEB86848.1 phosphoribosyl 1,2-cyclic phosphate phosphodiesterase [Beijerinckia sp. 28-YEA-48]